MILLFSMQVAQLALALSRHPSLSLHDLLCLVGTPRWLMTLRSVEVVEVVALRPIKVVRRVRARATGMGNSAIYK